MEIDNRPDEAKEDEARYLRARIKTLEETVRQRNERITELEERIYHSDCVYIGME